MKTHITDNDNKIGNVAYDFRGIMRRINTRRLRAAPSLRKRAKWGNGGSIVLPYNRKLKPRAQELRRNATPQENKIWYEFLRTHSCPFTRQKTIGNYIADFLCPSKKLVIEIDGSQHYTEDGIRYDRIRTEFFESLGLHVMRFTNVEITNSFEKICASIQYYIDLYNP